MEGRGVQAGRGVTGEAARRATEKFGLKQSSETLEKTSFGSKADEESKKFPPAAGSEGPIRCNCVQLPFRVPPSGIFGMSVSALWKSRKQKPITVTTSADAPHTGVLRTFYRNAQN